MPATGKTKEDLEEKYAGETFKSKLTRGASSEQRSVANCHQPSHLMKMSSTDIKSKKKKKKFHIIIPFHINPLSSVPENLA